LKAKAAQARNGRTGRWGMASREQRIDPLENSVPVGFRINEWFFSERFKLRVRHRLSIPFHS